MGKEREEREERKKIVVTSDGTLFCRLQLGGRRAGRERKGRQVSGIS